MSCSGVGCPSNRPLRIGIDGRPLIDGESRGFSRYTVELIRALQKKYGHAVHLLSFSPEPIHEIFQSALHLKQIIFSAAREILWEQYALPRQLKKHGVDVFHATANRGLPGWHACPYVLTLHDMVEAMEEFVPRGRLKSYLRRRYADYLSVHAADRIITVSEHSRKDINKYWKTGAGKVIVIHEAAAKMFFDAVTPKQIAAMKMKYSLPSEYLLYLGGFDKKKNVGALIQAYGLAADKLPPMVLAGEKKWDFNCAEDQIDSFGLSDKVFTPGRIENEDLPALYQGAIAFIYPSLYEGFGLQLIEAMASGIPVLASGRTCFPEVLNGAGLLFDPEKPESIVEQMIAVSSDRGLRAGLVRKSRERAKLFSWEKTALETMRVYREVWNISGMTSR